MRKKKITKNNVNNKAPVLFGVLVLLCVVMLSTGYSVFNSNLSASLSAVVRADKDVRITDISVASFTNGAVSNSDDYSPNNIYADVSLPNSNSTITYNVTVKNYGNVEMGIKSISLPSNLSNILNVSVSNYTIGDKIRDNNDSCESNASGCKLSIQRTFQITLSYKNGVYSSLSSTTFNNIILNFDFKEMHKVTFTGFGNYFEPTMQDLTVIDGGTYSKNIETYRSIAVKIGGADTSNFTVNSNNVITIPNVTDDLEIIKEVDRYYLRITTTPADATIEYTVLGHTYTVPAPFYDEFVEGTVIDVTVKKQNYTETSKRYTIGTQDINDTLAIERLYAVTITPNPADANIAYSINGGTTSNVSGMFTGKYVSGTTISATVSKTGYVSKTVNYTVGSQDISNTVKLDKLYNVAINTIPNNATITYSINNGSTSSVTGTFTGSYVSGTTISVTVSKSGYVTQSKSYTINSSDISQTIELVKLYTYKVVTNDNYGTYLTDSNITLTASNGQTASGGGTVSITVPEGTSVNWSASRDYYTAQNGTQTVTSDKTNTLTLNMKTKTVSLYVGDDRSNLLNTGNKKRTKTLNLESGAKVIEASSTGKIKNGIAAPKITFTVSTNGGNQLLYVRHNGDYGDNSVEDSYSQHNIYNAYTASSVSIVYEKDTNLFISTPDFTVTVTYAYK